MKKELIKFPGKHFNLAGTVFYPVNFNENDSYPAIIVSHPGSGNMEQTAGIYAKNMAEKGYLTLAYDAGYQGQSEGEDRYTESPADRVSDIRSAIDYLVTLVYVDENRIGALGICAGGGYTISTAIVDHRIKSLAAVAVADLGEIYRDSFKNDKEAIVEALEEHGRIRNALLVANENSMSQWLPNTQEERLEANLVDIDYQEAVDYYRTPRAQSEYSPNKLAVKSIPDILTYDPFTFMGQFLTQPILLVVGGIPGAYGSYRLAYKIQREAASKEKFIHVVEEASHFDLYDKEPFVSEAVERIADHFNHYL